MSERPSRRVSSASFALLVFVGGAGHAIAEDEVANHDGTIQGTVVKATLDSTIFGESRWRIEARYSQDGAVLVKRTPGSRIVFFEVYSARLRTFVQGSINTSRKVTDAARSLKLGTRGPFPARVHGPRDEAKLSGELGLLNRLVELDEEKRRQILGLLSEKGRMTYEIQSITFEEHPLEDYDVDGFVRRAVGVWENTPRTIK